MPAHCRAHNPLKELLEQTARGSQRADVLHRDGHDVNKHGCEPDARVHRDIEKRVLVCGGESVVQIYGRSANVGLQVDEVVRRDGIREERLLFDGVVRAEGVQVRSRYGFAVRFSPNLSSGYSETNSQYS